MRQPSAHERPRYVLYFRGHRPPDKGARIWVPIFEDPAKAHALLKKFIGICEVEWFENHVVVDNKWMVSSEQMRDILAATPTTVTEDNARLCLRFRLGKWDELIDELPVHAPIAKAIDEPEPTKPIKQPKAVKEKKSGKPDGYITIGELCTKWNIKPIDARSALRASDLVKPDYGWSFPPSEIPKIAKICGVKTK